MGFVSSSSTVTVQANLTAKGKKKLFDSLLSDNDQFITKFAYGDSDANYEAIDGGFGTLSAGHVPESSSYVPNLRSIVLAEGMYKPGTALLLVDGRYGLEHSFSMAVGANEASELSMKITTEWPKNTNLVEAYTMELQLPDTLTDPDRFSNLFNIELKTDNTLVVSFLATATRGDLLALFGNPWSTQTNNSTTLSILLIGKTSHVKSVINIDIKE